MGHTVVFENNTTQNQINSREHTERQPAMPDLECGIRSSLRWKIVGALSVVAVGIMIACIADSYHKINEGFVGIYFRHGALQKKSHRTRCTLLNAFHRRV